MQKAQVIPEGMQPPNVEIVKLIRVRFAIGWPETHGHRHAYAYYNERGELLTVIDGVDADSDQLNVAAIESIS